MQAVIKSKSGAFFKCQLESGDVVSIHESEFEETVEIGDLLIIKVLKQPS